MVALIRLRGWQLMLVRAIAIPILRKIASDMEKRAKATKDNKWDDVLAGAFSTVVEFLSSPETFERT